MLAPDDESRDLTELRLKYLIDQEKEERGERRGLEQRAAGLLAAMLVAFPVSATVAKQADKSSLLGVLGVAALVAVVLFFLYRAIRVLHALAVERRAGGGTTSVEASASSGRQQTEQALRDGDLLGAAEAQEKVVRVLRDGNVELVRQVRTETRGLTWGLVGLAIALALLILAGDGGA